MLIDAGLIQWFASLGQGISLIICFLIIVSFICGTYFLGKGKQFVDAVPSIITSLGILGTFIGIIAGLMDFDPKNIDGSIPTLLEGLKTAFNTSIVGMIASILFKLGECKKLCVSLISLKWLVNQGIE